VARNLPETHIGPSASFSREPVISPGNSPRPLAICLSFACRREPARRGSVHMRSPEANQRGPLRGPSVLVRWLAMCGPRPSVQEGGSLGRERVAARLVYDDVVAFSVVCFFFAAMASLRDELHLDVAASRIGIGANFVRRASGPPLRRAEARPPCRQAQVPSHSRIRQGLLLLTSHYSHGGFKVRCVTSSKERFGVGSGAAWSAHLLGSPQIEIDDPVRRSNVPVETAV